MSIADELTIRPATAEDLSAVAAIYNAGIAERIATFETDPRTAADIAHWPEDGQRFIVAERDGRVLDSRVPALTRGRGVLAAA
jgi:phosphinothricin acetyltransferase